MLEVQVLMNLQYIIFLYYTKGTVTKSKTKPKCYQIL